MRKLLLALACAVAVSASAQQQKMKINREQMASVKMSKPANASDRLDIKAPKKAAADFVYYRVPEGSMWVTVDNPLYTYNTPYMVVAPWNDLVYQNMSFDKTGMWEIVTGSGSVDMSEDVDEEGNLNYGYYTGGAGGYYAPQYTAGDVTYIPNNKRTGNGMVIFVDEMAFHSFVPAGVNGASIYSGGSLENGNLYGGGTLTYQDGSVGTSLGVVYTTPKPMDDLYVEKVGVWAIQLDNTLDPISDKSLTMNIYNLDDTEADPIVLTCAPADTTWCDREIWEGADTYMLNFSRKVLDEASGEMVEDPFVLNFPAEIHILGFDQEGVNIGLPGCKIADEFLADVDEEKGSNDLNQAWFIIRNEETGNVRYHYYQNIVPMVGFYSMYEHVEVLETARDTEGNLYKNANAIIVSDDGNDCCNYLSSEIEGVEVYTALDWEDEQSGEEMYWSDDMYDYDWIQNLTANQLYYSSGNPIGGAYNVGAVCDPLPAGETGRWAKIHLNGRGVTSGPIYIFQGDVDVEAVILEDGIYTARATAKSEKTYNLMGQEVNGNAKGLVIRDGKKFIVK